jgi:hypothetical protein
MKLYKMRLCGKCYEFLTNLYITSKARAVFNGQLSEEFPIHRGVRQGCPLSSILFNIFINNVLDNCNNYGVIIKTNGNEVKRYCGGLFADDIVLITLDKTKLKNLLNSVFNWSIKNEMTFGID